MNPITLPVERPSSPVNCAICLDGLSNKCFTNRCLHTFCFQCLVSWSKVKAECPLCKQSFETIIHNVRDNDDYDEYRVPAVETGEVLGITDEDISLNLDRYQADFAGFFNGTNRRFFSYRTTNALNNLHSHSHNQLIIQPYVLPMPSYPRNNGQSYYQNVNRQSIYRTNMEVRPPLNIGRVRECSPEFYRQNEAQIHRLGPWLHRELEALSYVIFAFHLEDALSLIMSLITRVRIKSRAFKRAIEPYFGRYTGHFIHEFYNFAISRFDMMGYDREAIYVPRRSEEEESSNTHRESSSSSSSRRRTFIVTLDDDDLEAVQVIPTAPTGRTREEAIHRLQLRRARRALRAAARAAVATAAATNSMNASQDAANTTSEEERSSNTAIRINGNNSHSDDTTRGRNNGNVSEDSDDCVYLGAVNRQEPGVIVISDSENELATANDSAIDATGPAPVVPVSLPASASIPNDTANTDSSPLPQSSSATATTTRQLLHILEDEQQPSTSSSSSSRQHSSCRTVNDVSYYVPSEKRNSRRKQNASTQSSSRRIEPYNTSSNSSSSSDDDDDTNDVTWHPSSRNGYKRTRSKTKTKKIKEAVTKKECGKRKKSKKRLSKKKRKHSRSSCHSDSDLSDEPEAWVAANKREKEKRKRTKENLTNAGKKSKISISENARECAPSTSGSKDAIEREEPARSKPALRSVVRKVDRTKGSLSSDYREHSEPSTSRGAPSVTSSNYWNMPPTPPLCPLPPSTYSSSSVLMSPTSPLYSFEISD